MSMDGIARVREDIYNFFHASNSASQVYFYARDSEYAAYYTSMYLLQDATESLHAHRQRGFSPDPFLAYIEFWGVMQAIIIQQDAIAELYKVIVGRDLNARGRNLAAWIEIRELRNVCAGHPAKQGRSGQNVVRSFMGRTFGNYAQLSYERWEDGAITHPTVQFGRILDAYALEAERELHDILEAMKSRWP